MYCFVDTYNDALNFIGGIDSSTCKNILDAYNSLDNILELYKLNKEVRTSLNELVCWSSEVSSSSNYLIRNLYTAEKLTRDFLFKFRTCLDHAETLIKQSYGNSSDTWNLFKEKTKSVYDAHSEYAFTYHLRNVSQHCQNIVHGFNGSTGIGISSNVQKLLDEYNSWKRADKEFMTSSGSDIDLLNTFSIASSSLDYVFGSVLEYLLNSNASGEKLAYVHNWGTSLSNQFHHDIHCYHIYHLTLQNGDEAEGLTTPDVNLDAYLIDWDAIYSLSDSVSTLSSDNNPSQ